MTDKINPKDIPDNFAERIKKYAKDGEKLSDSTADSDPIRRYDIEDGKVKNRYNSKRGGRQNKSIIDDTAYVEGRPLKK